MILVDANLLLYAYDKDSSWHKKARGWLETSFRSTEPFCFSWFTLTAFLRISTNPWVFHYPFTVAEAIQVVDDWLQQPNAVVLSPGDQHWVIFSRYLKDAQAIGPLATDAHLAA